MRFPGGRNDLNDIPQRPRPHTADGAGDVGDAGDVLRIFRGNRRVCASVARQEQSNEPKFVALHGHISDFGAATGLVTFSGLRESSWAGALAPARLSDFGQRLMQPKKDIHPDVRNGDLHRTLGAVFCVQ